jgi:hypothetical protein
MNSLIKIDRTFDDIPIWTANDMLYRLVVIFLLAVPNYLRLTYG